MRPLLRKIYTYKFFDEFMLIYPFYIIMFMESGLSPIQVSMLLTVWSIITLLLEIPSGAIADKYSRKGVLIFAQIVRILGYAIWIIFPCFLGFFIGFVMWGIKEAFSSGTFEALLYDELRKIKQEDQFTRVYGIAQSLAAFSILIVSVIASIVIAEGYFWVFTASFISLIISTTALLLLPKTSKTENIQEKEYFNILKEGLAHAIKNRTVLKLLLFISLSIAAEGGLEEFWPIFGSKIGLKKSSISLFVGAMFGAGALGSTLAYKFKLSLRSCFVLLALNGLLLLFASLMYSPVSIPLVITMIFLFAVSQIQLEGKLQKQIPSETRATVSSVKGFLSESMVIPCYLGFGLVAGKYNYRTGFISIALILIMLGVIYFVTSRKYTESQRNYVR